MLRATLFPFVTTTAALVLKIAFGELRREDLITNRLQRGVCIAERVKPCKHRLARRRPVAPCERNGGFIEEGALGTADRLLLHMIDEQAKHLVGTEKVKRRFLQMIEVK